MSLSVEQLRRGIDYWRQEGFPRDFHNSFYRFDLPKVQTNGAFDDSWWRSLLCLLKDWKATRNGPTDYILTMRAKQRFEILSNTWLEDIAPNIPKDISTVSWLEIARFPTVVAEIKDVSSPVFVSKFCHFLAPKIFPVTDNRLLGLPFPSYEEHFIASQREWLNTGPEVQRDLVELLSDEIGGTMCPGFPTKCKAIELCWIGRHHITA